MECRSRIPYHQTNHESANYTIIAKHFIRNRKSQYGHAYSEEIQKCSSAKKPPKYQIKFDQNSDMMSLLSAVICNVAGLIRVCGPNFKSHNRYRLNNDWSNRYEIIIYRNQDLTLWGHMISKKLTNTTHIFHKHYRVR